MLTKAELLDVLPPGTKLEDADQFLSKLTISYNDRFYLKKLATNELTSARNKLLELMLQYEQPLSKAQLTELTKTQLAEDGITVTEKDIASALKLIATGTAKSMQLK